MEENKEDINEKIDVVLERLRPFLQREGGNIELDHFDEETGICYVRMVGACNGCSLAGADVNDSVQVLLMDEIPEIKGVQLVAPEPQSLDEYIQRLKDEEKAYRELEEFNKNRNDKQ